MPSAIRREHVEAAVDERRPAALEERPARPTARPASRARTEPVRRFRGEAAHAAGEMAAHLERDHRDGEREADPEAPRHVDEFGIRARRPRSRLRFERHAADRAGARADLADLRMHRAGVDRARRRGPRRRLAGCGREVARRVRDEILAAAGAAEIRCRAVVFRLVLGGRRIDRHAADRIARIALGQRRRRTGGHGVVRRACGRPNGASIVTGHELGVTREVLS